MEEKQYRKIKEPINSSITVVQDNKYHWGAIDSEGKIIVPFGKYAWIDGFQNGLAKVIGHNDTTYLSRKMADLGLNMIAKKDQQGIINEVGDEVLPLEYNIWKFYGKNFPTIKYFKGDEEHIVRFETLNPNLANKSDNLIDRCDTYRFYDDYDSNDYRRDTWDAMTDGMYGDMPDGFDGDFDFLGY